MRLIWSEIFPFLNWDVHHRLTQLYANLRSQRCDENRVTIRCCLRTAVFFPIH